MTGTIVSVAARVTDRLDRRLRVLVVEDSATVAAMLQAGLFQSGIETDLARSGEEAIARKATFAPDVILLDLGLPDMDGFALIDRFAREGGCGLIVVTANGDEAARVEGLEIGADDYVVKPVRIRELAARVRALHRRMAQAGPGQGSARRPGPIRIDRNLRNLVGPDGEAVALTEAELAALETLLDAEGASVSREWLSRVALKRPLHADDRSVDQLVMKLRRKLAAYGASERTILAVRRQGYVISDSTVFDTTSHPSAS